MRLPCILLEMHKEQIQAFTKGALPMTTQSTQPITLYYSCAQNPQDQALLKQLDNHLTSLKQAGLLTTSWHTANLLAGSNTRLELSHPLNTAHIILLLISP